MINIALLSIDIFLQPTSKGTRDKYSAFAIFKNSEEAQQAYENVEGRQEKVHNCFKLFLNLDSCVGTTYHTFREPEIEVFFCYVIG